MNGLAKNLLDRCDLFYNLLILMDVYFWSAVFWKETD